MENVNTMAEFTEVLKSDPKHAYDFISNNYHKMDKEDLVAIVKELLYSIHHNCDASEMSQLLSDVAIELDEQYDEQYQELENTEVEN